MIRPGPTQPAARIVTARDLIETTDSAELFLYPGDQHLFVTVACPPTVKAPLWGSGNT
jgi:hypothetical protein